MSHSGLVRVTVTSSTRRVDAALPDAVPVADLTPELARIVGALEAGAAHRGHCLVDRGGRILDPGRGLAAQGVEDGGVLTVAPARADPSPPIHDDVAVALAEVVVQDQSPWDSATGRRTALAAALLLLLVAAVGLVLSPGAGVAPTAALATTPALVLGAVVASRLGAQVDLVLTLGGAGCGYAAVCGVVLARGSPPSGTTCAAAGAGCLAAALVVGLGLATGRVLMLPPSVAGAVFLASGVTSARTSYAPAVVLTVALTLVVLGGTAFPWLALATTSTGGAHAFVDGSPAAHPVDLESVRADARSAHEILLGLSAATGLLLALVSPFAVSCGPAGALVAVLCGALVMLRTRLHHSRSQVLVGVGSGVVGLASAAATAVWLEPSWRPGLAAGLCSGALLLLMLTQATRRPSVWLGRLGDLAETVTLLGLPPALVVATGLVAAVRG